MKAERLPGMEELRPGDWIQFKYGYSPLVFYVLEVQADQELLVVGRREWLVSSAAFVTYDDAQNGFKFLGSSKLRWWWKYLPFIRDLICPFTRPKGKWWL